MTLSVAEQIEQTTARRKAAARWVPGCGGSETPFVKNGRRLLYVWNGLAGEACEHAYLDLDTDMILSVRDEQALGLR